MYNLLGLIVVIFVDAYAVLMRELPCSCATGSDTDKQQFRQRACHNPRAGRASAASTMHWRGAIGGVLLAVHHKSVLCMLTSYFYS